MVNYNTQCSVNSHSESFQFSKVQSMLWSSLWFHLRGLGVYSDPIKYFSSKYPLKAFVSSIRTSFFLISSGLAMERLFHSVWFHYLKHRGCSLLQSAYDLFELLLSNERWHEKGASVKEKNLILKQMQLTSTGCTFAE